MKILVLNSGSSSIKYKLFSMQSNTILAKGIIEKIGQTETILKYKTKNNKIIKKISLVGHKEGIEKIVQLLTDPNYGIIKNRSEIKGVGHRVVHGGEKLKSATIIDDKAISIIKEMIPIAPLHNPANLTGIEIATKIFPHAIHVGVFDTSFHQTIPEEAFRYPIPESLYINDHIRRYGFHGTSHFHVAKESAKYLNTSLNNLNLITIHIGNGSSICAIKDGQSIDTSMGLTPLEGLMMGTRCGDIDPAIPYYLASHNQMNIESINNLLNKQSGLKGITGENDLRIIEEKFLVNGDPKAELAMKMYSYRIKKYIGSYFAALGHVDAVIFTAGIGENSDIMRSMACQGLKVFGMEIDKDKNFLKTEGVIREIGTDSSKVKILIVPTNEELEIAQQTLAVIEK